MSYTRKPACVNRVIFGAFSVLAWTQGAVTSLITTWGVHRKISVKMIIKCSLYCIAWNVVLKVSLHTNNEGNGNIFKLDLPNPDNAIFFYKSLLHRCIGREPLRYAWRVGRRASVAHNAC